MSVPRPIRVVGALVLPFMFAACKDKPKEQVPPAAAAPEAPAALAAPVAVPASCVAIEARSAPTSKSPSATPAPSPERFCVAFETSKGNFTIDVTRSLAPIGVDRFYEMVQSGFFADVRFFRVVPGFVAQFGMHGDPKINGEWMNSSLRDDPVKESNKRGTIVYASMMRPDTRSSQFFVNFGDNVSLDSQGFAPFGHVVEGMEVVDKINAEYGESPDQSRIEAEGNAYLVKAFPKLDYIKSAKVITK